MLRLGAAARPPRPDNSGRGLTDVKASPGDGVAERDDATSQVHARDERGTDPFQPLGLPPRAQQRVARIDRGGSHAHEGVQGPGAATGSVTAPRTSGEPKRDRPTARFAVVRNSRSSLRVSMPVTLFPLPILRESLPVRPSAETPCPARESVH